ncbi:hypothetical protein ACFWF7_21150 [Nocardia sp. NPDC060256]|uniref:hypothetical protein n=1 Tax=unclassified Nocardia TaxID=2637762 RepID=UPI0036500874
MQLRRTATTLVIYSFALGALTTAGPATAEPAASCGASIRQTQADLSQAGRPTNSNDYQGVRAAAVAARDEDNGTTRDVFSRDIDQLDATCK